ncbi:TetR/AcrR family transcriptional regulator [Lysinibacillus yapensis]|uniref:TetR/AcrR family transcriptional regulator n=1 Tax=Ureibacillus yapensis TaxID=2304605 RepID=A0A396SAY1_9BACL|nr:TetR/AcrR family transcriptional regulator [Lysinibacillus yapensis]RHW34015.1 TetR/AcrR family transcriptional regulator [Lysinibacillus yapensis]
MLKKYKYLDKRIIKTKRLLKNSFLQLLQEEEFEDISITSIVERARISRVTFYNHYDNKENLLNEIIDDVITDFVNAYREPYQTLKNFSIKDVKTTSLRVFDHVYRNATFYKAIVHSYLLTFFSSQLTLAIKKLGETDFRVSDSKINHDLYTTYLAYAIPGLIIEWVKDGMKYSPIYMSEQLMSIMIMSPEQRIKKLP